ncbi:MAG: DUF1330 domain-containing protein [Parvibaculum sp.]|jgi:uncharacterized protein (DUF1330 family)|uniref:DUF1330 domain-containing protein n=1 Tax=Parvibaculum sp. TaxID=2024848 RepID=UPI003264C919
MKVENAVRPGDEQLKSFFANAGTDKDGPVVMVNLLKFREHAAYPDGRDAHLSGLEAYLRYGAEVSKIVAKLGGRMIFAGSVDGLMLGEVDELWDQVALVEYPSRAAFLEMVMSPEYHAIEEHREAGLAGQLNIGTRQAKGA